jgi:hypothetical protein
MKKIIFSSAAFVAILLLSACHKGDATMATIEIMEPIANDTIPYNDSLHLEGTIEGDGNMYGYKLTYANAFTGEEYLSLTSEEKAKSYAFHEHWHNQVMDTTMLTLKVEATLDHKGFKTSKYLYVLCLPQ